MIDKANIEKTNAWPFVEAKKILRERKKYIDQKGKIVLQKLIKGDDINVEQSGLSKREWNELMIAFNLKDKLI